MLRKAKCTLVNIQKSQSRGSALFDQKLDPIRNHFSKKIEKIWLESLDYYTKDFKFPGYEDLINRKICPGELESKLYALDHSEFKSVT